VAADGLSRFYSIHDKSKTLETKKNQGIEKLSPSLSLLYHVPHPKFTERRRLAAGSIRARKRANDQKNINKQYKNDELKQGIG